MTNEAIKEAPGDLCDEDLLMGDAGSETSSMVPWRGRSAVDMDTSSGPCEKYESTCDCEACCRGGDMLRVDRLSERAYAARSAVSSRTLLAYSVLSIGAGHLVSKLLYAAHHLQLHTQSSLIRQVY